MMIRPSKTRTKASPPITLHESVFTSGNDYFAALLKDINQAKRSIIMETYIFDRDVLGLQIADALIAAAKRGVSVQLCVDGAGTPFWGGSLTTKLEEAGIETCVYHPIPWFLWQWQRSTPRLPFLKKLFHSLMHINSRNHRKVCLIDEKCVFVSSMNISKKHLSTDAGGDGWHDTGVRINGIDLSQLKTSLSVLWEKYPIQKRLHNAFKTVNTSAIFRLNNTRHRRRSLYKNLLRRVAKCKKRIWITNAYFVPDNFLLKKLKEAARNNVDVRILSQKKSDVMFMPIAASTFYKSSIESGVKIYEYVPSILHAKTIILDDWVLIGSSNMNHRSLLHDLEIDVNVRLPESRAIIETQFQKDITNANQISLDTIKKRPWMHRILGRILLYVKYWI